MKTKRVMLKFLPFEYKALEEYLKNQALRGWKLKSISGSFLKFEKIEPKKLNYSVEIVDEVSFFDGENSEDALNYRDYCTAAGWEYICQWEKFQIFCTKEESEIIPIHTDERLKFKNIMKASIKYESLYILSAILLLFTQINNFYTYLNAFSFANNLSILMFFISIIYASIHFSDGVAFMICYLKGKKSLKIEEQVQYTSYKNFNIKKKIEYSINIVIILILLYSILNGDNFLVKMIILAGIYIAINYFVMKKVSKSKFSTNKRRAIIIGAHIISLYILIFSFLNFIFLSNFQDKLEETNNGTITLTLKDFGITEVTERGYAKNNESILASYIIDGESTETQGISYDIFKGKFEWVNKYYKYRKRKIIESFDVRYDELDTSEYVDYKVYKNEHGHMYIMTSSNQYIEFSCYDTNFSDEMIIKIVYEKFFK